MSLTIQKGRTLKSTQGKITIEFPKSFSEILTVVISPYWSDSDSGVGVVDTITSVSTSSFDVVSANTASNYYVSWIAI